MFGERCGSRGGVSSYFTLRCVVRCADERCAPAASFLAGCSEWPLGDAFWAR